MNWHPEEIAGRITTKTQTHENETVKTQLYVAAMMYFFYKKLDGVDLFIMIKSWYLILFNWPVDIHLRSQISVLIINEINQKCKPADCAHFSCKGSC